MMDAPGFQPHCANPSSLAEQSVMMRIENETIGVYLREVFDTLRFRPLTLGLRSYARSTQASQRCQCAITGIRWRDSRIQANVVQ